MYVSKYSYKFNSTYDDLDDTSVYKVLYSTKLHL